MQQYIFVYSSWEPINKSNTDSPCNKMTTIFTTYLTYENPSILQITFPSQFDHESSQIVPQIPACSISTRPSQGTLPPTRRTRTPFATIINKTRSKWIHTFAKMYSYIQTACLVMTWDCQDSSRRFPVDNGRSSIANLLIPI